MPTDSQLDLDEYLAGLKPDPVVFRRAFLLLMRLHFADMHRAEPYDRYLRDYRYHPDNNQRTLAVDLMDLYDPDDLQTSPAVYVGTGDVVMKPVGTMDNTVGNSDDNSAKYYSNLGSCNVIVRNVASSPDEAYALAMQGSLFLSGMRPRIMDRLCLMNYQLTTAATEPTHLKKNPDRRFMSETRLGLTWQAQWRSVTESLRIKKFSLQFLTDSQ